MKKLGFGLMRLPLTEAGNYKSIDQEQVNKMVDLFLEAGFNYFDTAYLYHHGLSETAAKLALTERHKRDSFLIADKMPVFTVKTADDYERIFTDQLKKTGVEYFDYYLLHNLTAGYFEDTEKLGGFEFMKKLKAQGKAKKIGFSFHDKAIVLDKILSAHPEMEFVQLQINYFDWDSANVESGKCYETAVKHGKPVIVMEPVKGGTLAAIPPEGEKLFKALHPDWSPASWAIRYTASLDNAIVVLSGMSNLEQMRDNIGFMKDFKALNQEEAALIARVKKIAESRTAIPCTACRYCVDTCPQSIPIPTDLWLYNETRQFKLLPIHFDQYNLFASGKGKASSCIECGKCEEHCPQHIKIPEELKKVAELFEKAS